METGLIDKLDLKSMLDQAVSITHRAPKSAISDMVKAREVSSELVRDLKIEADRRLDGFILEQLARISNFPVLSEESGFSQSHNNEKNYRWIVDPLDGSLNFSRDIPLYCISISLWRGMDPLLGVIYDFNRNETFTGIVGVGAWLNGTPIKPSNVMEPSKAVLATGFPAGSDFSKNALLDFVEDIKKYKKIRLLGSAALSLSYVACGRVDIYQENGIKIWDVAAGLAIVKAAGGTIKVSDPNDEYSLNAWAFNPHLLKNCTVPC